MRIVIDLQEAQTESPFHSVGRHALSIAKAMVRLRGEHEIIIALSGLFPNTIESIRSEFKAILPQKNILVWYTPGPVRGCDLGNNRTRETAELIREAFLAKIQPDVVLITSLFAGFLDDVVTSIGKFDTKNKTAVILYDLIPLVDHNESFTRELYGKYYANKIESLRKANLLLSLTTSSKEECVRELDFETSNIGTIWAADDECFKPTQLTPEQDQELKNRAFSWDKIAKLVLEALERLMYSSKDEHHLLQRKESTKAKLAYVSPLPPVKTGVANYAFELLAELLQYYDIDVVLAQDDVSDWIKDKCTIRSIDWFEKHAKSYDRVLYQFGNNPLHQHMFDLLSQVPGVVIMHDFFISHLVGDMDLINAGYLSQTLYNSHGYKAVQEQFESQNDDNKFKYPCNLNALQQANGIIVHSKYALRLAKQWYGDKASDDWSVVPHLRAPAEKEDQCVARKILGIKKDVFLICSFGFLTPAKLNHVLLDAFLSSGLTEDSRVYLVFIGCNDGGEYGAELLVNIKKANLGKRLKITGWVDTSTYRYYLAAADIAVQLRTLSRGESSGTVLDCMNYGLATVVNANGSMAELPQDSVRMLADNFTNADLVNALESLWQDKELRFSLGRRALEIIKNQYSPAYCGKLCFESIERSYDKTLPLYNLIDAISSQEDLQLNDEAMVALSSCLAKSFPVKPRLKQLLVDITAIVREDLKTGIQRVVRAQLLELIKSPPKGFRVEPVYLIFDKNWHYRYARKYTCSLLGIEVFLTDEVVDTYQGDLLYMPDWYVNELVGAHKAGMFKAMKANGVGIHVLVHDLLSITHPIFFPPDAKKHYVLWLEVISELADNLICISRAVADDLKKWIKDYRLNLLNSLKITYTYHGADMGASSPTKGLPLKVNTTLEKVMKRPSFLMVGTIEPRKGHLQVIKAFEALWRQNFDVNLIIVGNEGWKGLPDCKRRTIPQIIEMLRNHSECHNRLLWLEGISDEYLEKIYDISACLIYASEGEGFGLPLIEAAQHKLPIIARDIPVFREIAGKYAFYFSGLEPEHLTQSIRDWLKLFKSKQYPLSDEIPWITWEQSVQALLRCLY